MSAVAASRIGQRLDRSDNSSKSDRVSDRVSDRMSDRMSTRSEEEEAARPLTAPFAGFVLDRAVDHFVPIGPGPSWTLAALSAPGGGTEQQVAFDGMKLSVLERARPLTGALPETVVTVPKRRRLSAGSGVPRPSEAWEVIYTSRRLSPRLTRPGEPPAAAGADLAAALDASAEGVSQASGPLVNGDAAAAAALLEVEARLYGATLDELVEAVRRVAPPQVGNSLAELSC